MSVEALPSQPAVPASLHAMPISDTRPDRTPASEPRALSAQALHISPTSSRASSPGQPAAVAALLSMNDERTRTSPRVPEAEQTDVSQARRAAGQSSSSSAQRASVSSAISASNPRPPSVESSPSQREAVPAVVEHEQQPRGSWPAAAPAAPRTKSSSAAAKRQTADNDHQHHHQQPSLQSQSWVTQNGQAPPRRRGRPPAMPSNGYERVLSPIPASHHTQNAPAQHTQHQMASHSSHGPVAPTGAGGNGNDNIQAVRMALDAVSRESARAGALQAQLDRALADVANLKQREQQMMREFDHRVDRAVKFHKQQLEAKVAAQQARIAQSEGRHHMADGMHESSTLIEDDSSASATASPDVEIDMRLKKHGSGPILRPVQYDLSENRRGSTASVDFDGHTPPPPQQQLPRLRTDTRSPRHAGHRSASGGQYTHPGRSSREYDGALESTSQKRMADDDTASERSTKRARTSDSSPNAVHVQTHPQYASPPKYDAQRVRLIYESDSKGNHVCRVCTLHSTDGQTVGFPVGTPDVDLVLHGMGAHPALWNSPLNNDAVTTSPRGK